MARTRKQLKRAPRRTASAQKFEHGINIGLLVTVIVVVLVASIWISYSLINRPLPSMGSSESTPSNYSSTYQIDETLK